MHILAIFWCFIPWHCPRNHASDVCVTLNGTGNSDHVEALRVYLLSRSISRLKNEFQTGNGKVGNLQRCNDVDDVYPLTLICFDFVLADYRKVHRRLSPN